MFLHVQRMINEIVPDEPDPAAANALQEGLGGQFGEMRTMMQYLFQAFNFRGATGKPYKDLLHGVGTEEISHVELIATTIARLLDGSPQYKGSATEAGRQAGQGRRDAAVERPRRGQHPPLPRRRAGCTAGRRRGQPVVGLLRLQLRQPGARPALQPHARVHRPAAEVPHLRDDRQQDGPRDDRLPDRARPGPRERLRQGAGDARASTGARRCRSPRPTPSGSPRSRSCSTRACTSSSTRSAPTTSPRRARSTAACARRHGRRAADAPSRRRRASRWTSRWSGLEEFAPGLDPDLLKLVQATAELELAEADDPMASSAKKKKS